MTPRTEPGGTGQTRWRVAVVEDDPMVLHIHRRWISELSEFHLVGAAMNGKQAVNMIRKIDIDLLILDLGLDGRMQGLDVLETVRREGCAVDSIVVTANRGPQSVESALRLGASDYLLKPFTRERFHSALSNYHERRNTLLRKRLAQQDIDRLWRAGSPPARSETKGISANTLDLVVRCLEGASSGLTAAEVGNAVGVSRNVARRYLEHLRISHAAKVTQRYGTRGRPLHLYNLDGSTAR